MLCRGTGVGMSRLDGRAAEEGGTGTQQSQGPPHSLTLVTRGLLLDHGQWGPGGRSAQRVGGLPRGWRRLFLISIFNLEKVDGF